MVAGSLAQVWGTALFIVTALGVVLGLYAASKIR